MQINDSAKTILCYGDSNTWGNVPHSDDRYPRSVRWPGILQAQLGTDFDILSEGLCGRTLVAYNPDRPQLTGITHLQAIIESADPIDLIIIMLGTNDVKTTYNLTASEIAGHLKQTITLIQNLKGIHTPKILVVCPPPVIMPEDGNLDDRMKNASIIFKSLPSQFKEVASALGCDFLNAGEYISSSKVDGYHLDKDAHVKLGEVLKDKILGLNL